jgi:hypothetical protein
MLQQWRQELYFILWRFKWLNKPLLKLIFQCCHCFIYIWADLPQHHKKNNDILTYVIKQACQHVSSVNSYVRLVHAYFCMRNVSFMQKLYTYSALIDNIHIKYDKKRHIHPEGGISFMYNVCLWLRVEIIDYEENAVASTIISLTDTYVSNIVSTCILYQSFYSEYWASCEGCISHVYYMGVYSFEPHIYRKQILSYISPKRYVRPLNNVSLNTN